MTQAAEYQSYVTSVGSILDNPISRRNFSVYQKAVFTTNSVDNLLVPSMSRRVDIIDLIGFIKYKLCYSGYRCNYKDLLLKVSKSATISKKGELIFSILEQIARPVSDIFDLDDVYSMHNLVQQYLKAADMKYTRNKNAASVAARIMSEQSSTPPKVTAGVIKELKRKKAESTITADSKSQPLPLKTSNKKCKLDDSESKVPAKDESNVVQDTAKAPSSTNKGLCDQFMKTLVGEDYDRILHLEKDCVECVRVNAYNGGQKCIRCLYINITNIIAVFYNMFGLPYSQTLICEFRNTLDGIYLLRSHAPNTVCDSLNSTSFHYYVIPNVVAYSTNLRSQMIPMEITHLVKSFRYIFDNMFARANILMLPEYRSMRPLTDSMDSCVTNMFYGTLAEVVLYIKTLGYLSEEVDTSAHTKALHPVVMSEKYLSGCQIRSAVGVDKKSSAASVEKKEYNSVADLEFGRIKIIDIRNIVLRVCTSTLSTIMTYYYHPNTTKHRDANWRNVAINKLVQLITDFFVGIVDLCDSNARSSNQMLALYDSGNDSISDNYKVVVNIYSILAALNDLARYSQGLKVSHHSAEDILYCNRERIDILMSVDHASFTVENTTALPEIQKLVNTINGTLTSGVCAELRNKLARDFGTIIRKLRMWYLKGVHVQTLSNINVGLEKYTKESMISSPISADIYGIILNSFEVAPHTPPVETTNE
jgi:hypothetical protein